MRIHRLESLVTATVISAALLACSSGADPNDLLPGETEDPIKGGNCARSHGPHCADAAPPTTTTPDAAVPDVSVTPPVPDAAVPDVSITPPVPDAAVPDVGVTPPATCTSFTYSAWGACQTNNTQTRALLSSSPAGCTGGSPVVSQTCTYIPPVVMCTSFTYSTWGACQTNNTQARTVLSSSPAGCTGGSPVVSQACTYIPPVVTCTSFTYSAWGTCQPNNTQTRTVVSSSPAGCTAGSPVLSQSCTYIDGAALYTQYCSGCHGNAKKGASVTAIQGAINNNTGGMGVLSSLLTPAQIAAISAAP